MFEVAEIGQSVDKATFEAELPELRIALLNAQFDLRTADFPVIILIDGDDYPHCQAIFNALPDWMDGRGIDSHGLLRASQEEQEYPHMWRFWRTLPAKGRIGAYIGSWTLGIVRDRLWDEIDDAAVERRMQRVRAFERELVEDGALLLKFWLHVPKSEHRKRAKKSKKSPDEAWRYGEYVATLYERYDEAIPLAERILRGTSTGECPWTVVESTNRRYAMLKVARTIHEQLQARLELAACPVAQAPDAPASDGSRTVLDTVDLDSRLDKDDYEKQLERWQGRIARNTLKARYEHSLSTVLVFEGWDAAGKGGTIRRITAAMAAQDVKVVSIAAPTEEERAHHYLWRFWKHVPRAGRMTIFDRSWYGRVLVERVEGFARPDEWRRSYAEIVDFEQQLADAGMLVLKFWLHIDPEEQLRRFEAREQTPYKKYKITDEDYRNRDRWDDYTLAVNEMVSRTSSASAPWILVPSNDKRWARVQVLETLGRALKERL